MMDLAEWFQAQRGLIIRVVFLLAISYPLIRFAEAAVRRLATKKLSPQSLMLVTKGTRYGLFVLLVITLLNQMGVNLTALLGAAGVAGVAIGFASQTSLSNVISGIFLVSEKPFEIGDAIQIGDTLGIVHSIDLMSVKLRTFDNRFVRIPNESLVKNQFTNVTRFPIRRFDINIGVAYKEDIERVMRILKDIADQNPFVLDEPEPLVIFTGFGDSSLDFLIGAWFEKSDMLKLRNSIMPAIKKRFDEEGIEIPFPHRSLYTGSVTDPFPIRIVGSGSGDESLKTETLA